MTFLSYFTTILVVSAGRATTPMTSFLFAMSLSIGNYSNKTELVLLSTALVTARILSKVLFNVTLLLFSVFFYIKFTRLTAAFI